MADRYYAPNVDPSSSRHTLDGPEAHHLIDVCRARAGTEVVLFDGRGVRVHGRVLQIHKRHAELELGECMTSPPPPAFVVATALPKGDRALWLIEKCVELGATRVIPLVTARSVTHPREGKRDKLQRVAIEACKQCGRDHLMTIDAPTPWEKVLDALGNRWLFDPGGEDLFSTASEAADAVAIGPEGGWTSEEIDAARAAGWRVVSLPGHVLRIETAALAAACLARLPAGRVKARGG